MQADIDALHAHIAQMQAEREADATVMRRMSGQLQTAHDHLQLAVGQAALERAAAEAERTERRAALELCLAQSASTQTVDTKGVGQPSKFDGAKGSDFSEWSRKFVVYCCARYSGGVDVALRWAAIQRKRIVEQTLRADGAEVEWTATAWAQGHVEEWKQVLPGIYTYLIGFTVAAANRIV